MPKAELSDEDFDSEGNIDILTLLVKTGLVASKSEARRAVEQGGVSLEGEKVADVKISVAKSDLECGKLLRRGKKNFVKVTVNS